jgi:hypothetical protein
MIMRLAVIAMEMTIEMILIATEIMVTHLALVRVLVETLAMIGTMVNLMSTVRMMIVIVAKIMVLLLLVFVLQMMSTALKKATSLSARKLLLLTSDLPTLEDLDLQFVSEIRLSQIIIHTVGTTTSPNVVVKVASEVDMAIAVEVVLDSRLNVLS